RPYAVDVAHELDGHVTLKFALNAAAEVDHAGTRRDLDLRSLQSAVNGQLALRTALNEGIVRGRCNLNEVRHSGISEGLGKAASLRGELAVFGAATEIGRASCRERV